MELDRRQLLTGLVAFWAGWLGVSLKQWWENRNQPREACRTNLRIIYAGVKVLAPAGNLRGVSPEQLAIAFKGGIRIPPKLIAYISGKSETAIDEQGRGEVLMEAQTVLICPADPDFATRVMLSKAPAYGFQPSYQFFPNLHTVAYCPFHHLSVWQDGTIHVEEL